MARSNDIKPMVISAEFFQGAFFDALRLPASEAIDTLAKLFPEMTLRQAQGIRDRRFRLVGDTEKGIKIVSDEW